MSDQRRVLEGKTAVITGAGSGIGRETALLFANNGAQVVVVDRNTQAGLETLALLNSVGGKGHFVEAEVADARQVEAMIEAAVSVFGRIDCAVNNAAVAPDSAPIAELDDREFTKIIDVNLRGVALCLKYEIRQLIRQATGGSIVNIGSTRSFKANPNAPAYTAAKFGVIGLTESAAVAYGPYGIRVNAVCPGVVDTPMVKGRRQSGLEDDRKYLARVGGVLGRFGRPSEIAEAALWLCSDASSYVTGHSLLVDGGFLAR